MLSAASVLATMLVVQLANTPDHTSGAVEQQTGQPMTKTGVVECDEYFVMASACLPRMCEVERGLSELELSFHQEILSKMLELKGRDEAAKACAQDVVKLLQDDPYGCFDAERAKRGMPAAGIQDVQVRPQATSVTISFQAGSQASGEGPWEVAIAFEDLEPLVHYVPMRSGKAFVLNTAVDWPMTAVSDPTGKPLSVPQAFRLDSGVSYCFAIKSPGGDQRRGSFTTLRVR